MVVHEESQEPPVVSWGELRAPGCQPKRVKSPWLSTEESRRPPVVNWRESRVPGCQLKRDESPRLSTEESRKPPVVNWRESRAPGCQLKRAESPRLFIEESGEPSVVNWRESMAPDVSWCLSSHLSGVHDKWKKKIKWFNTILKWKWKINKSIFNIECAVIYILQLPSTISASYKSMPW
jgi:hypothetical protein